MPPATDTAILIAFERTRSVEQSALACGVSLVYAWHVIRRGLAKLPEYRRRVHGG